MGHDTCILDASQEVPHNIPYASSQTSICFLENLQKQGIPIPEPSWNHSTRHLESFNKHFRHRLEAFQTLLDTSRHFSRNIQEPSTCLQDALLMPSGCVPYTSQGLCNMKTFQQHSRGILETFQKHSRSIPEPFQTPSRTLLETCQVGDGLSMKGNGSWAIACVASMRLRCFSQGLVVKAGAVAQGTEKYLPHTYIQEAPASIQ